MQRRDFLKLSTAVGIAGALPWWGRALAAERPALPIPALLEADASGLFQLRAQPGQMLWRRQPTRSWGYNGNLLGPTLRARQGQAVRVRVANQLAETTTIHWHGLEVPGTADGGPQASIPSGKEWQAAFRIEQPAATCWYHPHTHGQTGHQVAMGLAGLFILDDEESLRLPLPQRWGVDDIPLVLQDKRLDGRDQVDYQLDVMSAAVGWFGDLMLTNGAVYPTHDAPPRLAAVAAAQRLQCPLPQAGDQRWPPLVCDRQRWRPAGGAGGAERAGAAAGGALRGDGGCPQWPGVRSAHSAGTPDGDDPGAVRCGPAAAADPALPDRGQGAPAGQSGAAACAARHSRVAEPHPDPVDGSRAGPAGDAGADEPLRPRRHGGHEHGSRRYGQHGRDEDGRARRRDGRNGSRRHGRHEASGRRAGLAWRQPHQRPGLRHERPAVCGQARPQRALDHLGGRGT